MQINKAGQEKNFDIEKLKLQETQLTGEITNLEDEYSIYESERTLEMSSIEGDLFENMNFISKKEQEITQADGNRATAESNANAARSEMQAAQEDTNAKSADMTAAQGEATQAQGEATEAASNLNAANSALAQATSNANAAQSEVNAASGEVSNAQSQLNAAEGQKSGWDKLKDAVKSAISNAISAAKSLLSKAMAKLNSAKAKLQEMLGIKQNKQSEAEKAKVISDKAQENLTKKQEEVQKANELYTAAQVILSAKTGEYEVSEEELAAAIEVVEQARAEQAEAQGKADELNGKKSEVQAKYETVLSQVSDLIAGKEVDLEKIRNDLHEMSNASFEQSEQVAVESYLKAALEMEAIDIGTGKPKTEAEKAKKEEFEEKKKALDKAILSGDQEAIEKAYKEITKTEYNRGDVVGLACADSYSQVLFSIPEGETFSSGINKEAIDIALKKEMKGILNDFENAVDGQGTLGDITNFANNFIGLGTSEKEAREKLEKYEQMVNRLETCTNPSEYAAIYKAITGKELTHENAEKLVSGTKQITDTKINETVERYKDTQESISNGSIVNKTLADKMLGNNVQGVENMGYREYKLLRDGYVKGEISLKDAKDIMLVANKEMQTCATKFGGKKYDIINNIVNGPRLDNEFAKEIENIGKQYGIDIKLDNNIVTMEWARNHPEAELNGYVMDDDFTEKLANSLATIKSYGQALPEQINITNLTGGEDNVAGWVRPGMYKDLVNLVSYEANVSEEWLTTVLCHEIAHLDDYGQGTSKDGDAYSMRNKNISEQIENHNESEIRYQKGEGFETIFGGQETCSKESIEKYIGNYALTNSKEFVAETTTLLAKGTITKDKEGNYTIKDAEQIVNEDGTIVYKCEFVNPRGDIITEVNANELEDIMGLYDTLTGGYEQLITKGTKGRK